MTKIKKAEAKRICLELWDWCRQTGKSKIEWPEWGHYIEEYPGINRDFCPYCYYAGSNCNKCPIVLKLGFKCKSSVCHYRAWEVAMSYDDIEEAKVEADLFYQQLLKT